MTLNAINLKRAKKITENIMMMVWFSKHLVSELYREDIETYGYTF